MDCATMILHQGLIRTFSKCRLMYGEDKEVNFRQEKELGQQGSMDFTWTDFIVTIYPWLLKVLDF